MRVTLEEVRKAYSVGRYLSTFRLAERLLPETTGAKRCDLLWLAGKAADNLGLWQEARDVLLELLQSPEVSRSLAARATLRLTRALYETGEATEAEQRLLTLLSDLTPEEHELQGWALYNLAWLYQKLSRTEDALAAYQQAAWILLQSSTPEVAVSALQNAAWTALSTGLPEGKELVRRCADLLHKGTAAHRTPQVAMEALVALLEGRYTEAIATAEELILPSHQHATSWDRALAAYVICQASELQGFRRGARSFCGKAHFWAQETTDPRLKALVQHGLASIQQPH